MILEQVFCIVCCVALCRVSVVR